MSNSISRVLLLGWDAADWKMIEPLLELGQMPHLKRLLEEGVSGNVASLTPMLSPMLWNSIATGKYADKHGIMGFVEPDGTTGGVRPVTSTSRRCKALWNIASDRGLRSIAINWFASHPAERIEGAIVSDRFPHATVKPDEPWPMVKHAVHPEGIAPDLADLRMHPAETTPQQVAPFVPLLASFDSANDQKVQQLRHMLAQAASVHNAATHLLEHETWDLCCVYFDTIDRFAHAFMEYHPPRMPHLDETAFERFKDVMTGCYRFHDMMLGRYLDFCDEETAVIIVSDHGFHCDDLRPEGTSAIKDGQPVAWHRPYGMLSIWGPGIRKGERVYGASLLDICPTILTMLGLPVAKDMDGQSLTQIFEERPEVESIETYEDGTRHDAEDAEDPWVAQQMLEQLKALGYVETDDVEDVVVDRDRNLGQVFASTGRHAEAIEAFRRVLERRPDEKGAKVQIGASLMAMGDLDECEAILDEALEADDDLPKAHLFKGMIAQRRGRLDEALEHLLLAEKHATSAGISVQIGNVHMQRERLDDAKACFDRALEQDRDCAEAWDGLGVVHRLQGRRGESVHAHMQSIALLHHRPQSHVHLGMALAEVGRVEWAIRAFDVALDMDPDNVMAHACLAQLYERAKRDPERADRHRTRAREISRARAGSTPES